MARIQRYDAQVPLTPQRAVTGQAPQLSDAIPRAIGQVGQQVQGMAQDRMRLQQQIAAREQEATDRLAKVNMRTLFERKSNELKILTESGINPLEWEKEAIKLSDRAAKEIAKIPMSNEAREMALAELDLQRQQWVNTASLERARKIAADDRDATTTYLISTSAKGDPVEILEAAEMFAASHAHLPPNVLNEKIDHLIKEGQKQAKQDDIKGARDLIASSYHNMTDPSATDSMIKQYIDDAGFTGEDKQNLLNYATAVKNQTIERNDRAYVETKAGYDNEVLEGIRDRSITHEDIDRMTLTFPPGHEDKAEPYRQELHARLSNAIKRQQEAITAKNHNPVVVGELRARATGARDEPSRAAVVSAAQRRWENGTITTDELAEIVRESKRQVDSEIVKIESDAQTFIYRRIAGTASENMNSALVQYMSMPEGHEKKNVMAFFDLWASRHKAAQWASDQAHAEFKQWMDKPVNAMKPLREIEEQRNTVIRRWEVMDWSQMTDSYNRYLDQSRVQELRSRQGEITVR